MTTTIADEVKEAIENTTKTEEVEKKLEIIIDDSTGLPLLPDGMFWRVAEYEKRHYPRYSYRNYTTRMHTGVQLIQTEEIEKTREIPVFGTRWYNKNIVVEHKPETYHELVETVVASEYFDEHGLLYDDDKVPAIAVNVRESSESFYDRLYDIPISDAGVAYLAAKIYEKFYEDSRNEAYDHNAKIDEEVRKKLEDIDKARLLGDYPPKTLMPA